MNWPKSITLILLTILLLTPFPPRSIANDEPWLNGWTYKKSHVINSATGAGTDYQKTFIVHYGEGEDSGQDVYLDGECQIDFDDIRWTDNDGITLLDYELDNKFDEDNATFCVEIADDISIDPATIYIYYGNPEADSISNGTATFIIFEDNEDGGKYTWTAGPNGATDLVTDPAPPRGTYSRRVYGTDTEYYARYASAPTNQLTASNRLEFWFRTAFTGSRTDVLLNFGEPDVDKANLANVPITMCDGAGAGKQRAGNFSYMDGSFTVSDYVIEVDTWYFIEILVKSTTEADYFLYSDAHVQLKNVTGVSLDGFSTATSLVYLYSGTIGSYYTRSFFDHIRAGKYVSPEPSHGAWGPETTETTPPPPPPPPPPAPSSRVIWSGWLTVAGTALEMTSTQAGTLLSLAITIVIVLAILITTRGRRAEYTVSIGALLCMILFTFMGWMPVWTGSLIGIVLALFIANVIRGWF